MLKYYDTSEGIVKRYDPFRGGFSCDFDFMMWAKMRPQPPQPSLLIATSNYVLDSTPMMSTVFLGDPPDYASLLCFLLLFLLLLMQHVLTHYTTEE